MDEREKNLPKWAQEHIAHMRKQFTRSRESDARELATLRPKMELLQRKVEAMTELLDCAAKGGHMTATAIMEIIQAYSLTLTKED